MIRIERSETAQKSALEIWDKFSPRQNSVQEFFFWWLEFFFFQTEFCLGLYLSQTEFCLRLYLSWTEFCLRLNLSWTEFCLGLHTVVVFRMQSFIIVSRSSLFRFIKLHLLKCPLYSVLRCGFFTHCDISCNVICLSAIHDLDTLHNKCMCIFLTTPSNASE